MALHSVGLKKEITIYVEMTEFGITKLVNPPKAVVEYLILDVFAGYC